MALDAIGLVCKYILFLFNLIFGILGFVLLGLGLWLRFSDITRPIFEIGGLSSSTFVCGVITLIALGTVMLILVTIGDYGACSEKKCALQLLHCCGVTGITLLEFVKQTCPKPQGFVENIAMPTCPGVITNLFTSSAPMVMAIFIVIGALLFIALICSLILKAKLNESSSPSPPYIILTNASPSLPNLSQHQLDPDQDPIVFPPLTLANTTVGQI
ncbi:CD9 antigen-like isoform X3 [Syngnathus scovelli]|uniref:CD9 antigen-like isoform X3 n=1 Tax=Syngnathus scovelli TaxID=161590 RepID=UPI0035CA95C0